MCIQYLRDDNGTGLFYIPICVDGTNNRLSWRFSKNVYSIDCENISIGLVSSSSLRYCLDSGLYLKNAIENCSQPRIDSTRHGSGSFDSSVVNANDKIIGI